MRAVDGVRGVVGALGDGGFLGVTGVAGAAGVHRYVSATPEKFDENTGPNPGCFGVRFS